MTQTFKKKNDIVEAIQWTNQHGNWESLREWTGFTVRIASPLLWEPIVNKIQTNTLEVDTPDGAMLVTLGTWIIKHEEGVFYPCSNDCFTKLYNPNPQP